MINDKGKKMTLRSDNGRNVTVRLEINPKARRLILRLDELRREAVAVAPHKKKLNEAAEFAKERVNWIADRLAELPERIPLTAGQTITVRGAPYKISLRGPGRRASLIEGEPAWLCAPGDAETLPRRVERFLRKEARSDITEAVERHCLTLGTTAKAISIKDTRSRWGSCTSDGRLSFSWRLILAPPEILDYVAAHECAHLIEMNHSAAFWHQVSKCCPDWKQKRNWLRAHGRQLHSVGV